MEKIKKFLKKLSKDELLKTYSILLEVLKEADIIRTNNLVGDLGETYAIALFNSNSKLPNLKQTEPNEKAYDATTKNKKTYAIKSTSSKKTGIFWGLEQKGSRKKNKKMFDVAVVVKFDKKYKVENVYQVGWNTFLELKVWHPTMKGWYLSLDNKSIGKFNKIQ